MNHKCIAYIFVLLFVSPLVFGIGLSPTITHLNYEPGKSEIVSFKVLNNDPRNVTISVSVEGPFKDFITLEKKELFIPKGEWSRINYTFVHPQNLRETTLSSFYVSPDYSIEDVTFGVKAILQLKTDLQVHTPENQDIPSSPSLEKLQKNTLTITDFVAKEYSLNKLLKFAFLLSNNDVFSYDHVTTKIEIFDQTHALLTTLTYPEITLKGENSESLEFYWEFEDISLDTYTMKITVYSEDQLIYTTIIYSTLTEKEVIFKDDTLGGFGNISVFIIILILIFAVLQAIFLVYQKLIKKQN